MARRDNPKGIVAFSPRLAQSAYLGLPNQNENNANGVVAWAACGWCKDRWGISWQITPRVLTDALAAGGAEAKRVFAAMMDMGKIDIAKIEAARRR